MGSHRIGHDRTDLAAAAAATFCDVNTLTWPISLGTQGLCCWGDSGAPEGLQAKRGKNVQGEEREMYCACVRAPVLCGREREGRAPAWGERNGELK